MIDGVTMNVKVEDVVKGGVGFAHLLRKKPMPRVQFCAYSIVL